MNSSPSSSRPFFSSPGLWFALLLFVFCVWVLALPIFPSHDGPIHRYYVHVLDSLLQHQSTYAVYQVRHPFPPYATHYLLLLGLSHLFSFDLAEKIFVCIAFICFALGFRMTAKAVGPSGEWAALFFTPLLLSWSMMMGFFNYAFGLGLVLLATAYWQRTKNGSRWAPLGYLLAVAVVTFTHPIPLLLLISITLLDLALSCGFRQKALQLGAWFRQERMRVALCALTLLAFSFPAHSIDHNKANTLKTIQDTTFKASFLRTEILLTGVSPYNTRSHDLWVNGYRLVLYVTLFGAAWIGGRESVRALRERRPNLGSTLFVSLLILAVALPILPNEVNGSYFFSTRITLVLWPAALIAAALAPAPGRTLQQGLLLGAVLSAVLSLIPAQIFLVPAAKQLAAVEKLPLSPKQTSLILLGDDLPDYSRFAKQLAFDPYLWAPALPMVQHDEIALDAPWMDQKIAPLAPAPGSPILLLDVAQTSKSTTDLPLVKGRSLPGQYEAELVGRASLLVYSASPAEIAKGLTGQLSPEEAARFHCSVPQDWYMVCQAKATP